MSSLSRTIPEALLDDAVLASSPFNMADRLAKAVEQPAEVTAPTVHFASLADLFQAEILDHGAEDAFYVADLGRVYQQFLLWREHLPRVHPFYAVKCNPDPVLLRLLAKLGAGFDCASRAEIEAVLPLTDCTDNIVYANPCKQASHLRYSAAHGVAMMTFDNYDELVKIRRLHPRARLILRVLADDSKSVCQLGMKFGVPPHATASLLRQARELGLDVAGVSFHVGSGCRDAATFRDAVQRAHVVFQEGRALGYDMHVLDIGGGFPGWDGESDVTFIEAATVLRKALDEYFPSDAGVRIIGEPGRFFAAAAFSLAVNVIARREISGGSPAPDAPVEHSYYVNDGVYGSFNCIMFDHAVVTPEVMIRQGTYYPSGRDSHRGSPVLEGSLVSSGTIDSAAADRLRPCKVWGPTCDGIDCINESARLPTLEVGDWLVYHNMGAYTICAASQFNGFQIPRVIYTDSRNVIPYQYLI
ncbi:Ornithine decarboxylase [Tieghemiomyces parasiticus]|uniref:ornithine decarboxylase n=1 Tax=Tieghemiomyces parasiticus TaxID=78921 RepID=A0A9W8AG50_9FUNG|nr:Ornithine decarboxylase [Tieghemiomyces parasiticus]